VRDVLEQLLDWWQADQTVGMGLVTATWRSAPRPAGAAMLVGPDGTVVGSVSGGCVEGAVYDLAQDVVATGEAVNQRYGISNDDAFAVGLVCGGVLDVFVAPVDRRTFPSLEQVAATIRADEPVAVATCVSGPGPVGARIAIWPDRHEGSFGSDRFDDAVIDDARGLLAMGETRTLHYGPDGERRGDEVTVFVEAFAPRPHMIVFGAIDFARAVAQAGAFLGYRVTVCDARPVFATTSRFPEADEVVVEWPHVYLERTVTDERTVICVLTHDPKFDVPVLKVALNRPAAYVGAMGSRATHEDRLRRLAEAGVTAEQAARLHSPIGLDLGGRTPEETAISIAAEVIAIRRGGSGRQLIATSGPLHHDVPERERMLPA
jgi:xanthine dehydrogenase accessory factor